MFLDLLWTVSDENAGCMFVVESDWCKSRTYILKTLNSQKRLVLVILHWVRGSWFSLHLAFNRLRRRVYQADANTSWLKTGLYLSVEVPRFGEERPGIKGKTLRLRLTIFIGETEEH